MSKYRWSGSLLWLNDPAHLPALTLPPMPPRMIPFLTRSESFAVSTPTPPPVSSGLCHDFALSSSVYRPFTRTYTHAYSTTAHIIVKKDVVVYWEILVATVL